MCNMYWLKFGELNRHVYALQPIGNISNLNILLNFYLRIDRLNGRKLSLEMTEMIKIT